jgi:hypothetical protein
VIGAPWAARWKRLARLAVRAHETALRERDAARAIVAPARAWHAARQAWRAYDGGDGHKDAGALRRYQAADAALMAALAALPREDGDDGDE